MNVKLIAITMDFKKLKKLINEDDCAKNAYIF